MWASLRAWLITFRAVLITVVYLAIGCIYYHAAEDCETDGSDPDCVEPWSVIDSLYFSVVTISTVGYGDLVPGTRGAKIFTMFYIFFGITVVFNEIGTSLSGALAKVEHWFLHVVDRFDKSENVAGRQLGL